MNFLVYFLIWSSLLIFVYFILLQSYYLLQLLCAIPQVIKRFRQVQIENFEKILKSVSVPQVSIIIPAYNEENCISINVDNLLNLSYRNKEIIIVNDGSTDSTLEILKNKYDLVPIPPMIPMTLPTKKIINYYRSHSYPNLIVIDKDNGGKIDANNAGINACSSDYYLIIDADSIVLEDTIERLILPFFMYPNIIAAGGTIGIGNGCDLQNAIVSKLKLPSKPLLGIQVIEYLRAFSIGRLGWNALGGTLLISGAFSIFVKKHVVEIGGYKQIIGDDVDLVIRLQKRMLEKKEPYKIQFVSDIVVLTQVPSSLSSLKHQRERWQRGIINAVWNNRQMLLNPLYSHIGMISYPLFIFSETISPIVELFGVFVFIISWIFQILNWYAVFWFFILATGFPIMLSFFCILLQSITFRWYHSLKDYIKMFGYAILEQIGYRQYVLIFRFLVSNCKNT